MKRLFVFLAAFLLLFSLSGCKSKDETYNRARDGVVYTVDPANQTITDGTYTYHYTLSRGSSEITVTYPDGSYYWDRRSTDKHGISYGTFSGSKDYDEDRYVSGDTLCDVVRSGLPKESKPKNVLLILLLLVVGIFNTCSPKSAWYLSTGWQFRDAEPSDDALVLTRLGGIVCLAIGIGMIFL